MQMAIGGVVLQRTGLVVQEAGIYPISGRSVFVIRLIRPPHTGLHMGFHFGEGGIHAGQQGLLQPRVVQAGHAKTLAWIKREIHAHPAVGPVAGAKLLASPGVLVPAESLEVLSRYRAFQTEFSRRFATPLTHAVAFLLIIIGGSQGILEVPDCLLG